MYVCNLTGRNITLLGLKETSTVEEVKEHVRRNRRDATIVGSASYAQHARAAGDLLAVTSAEHGK